MTERRWSGGAFSRRVLPVASQTCDEVGTSPEHRRRLVVDYCSEEAHDRATIGS